MNHLVTYFFSTTLVALATLWPAPARTTWLNIAAPQLDFAMLPDTAPARLPGMRLNAHRISQPGGTGNVGALRTLKAVQRASPVGPIGHRSMAASVRNVDSLFGRSTVRVSPPVSMGLRTIEMGGANLAQRQDLRAFARLTLGAKVLNARSAAMNRLRFIARIRSAVDAKSIVQGRHVERSEGSADPPVLLSATTAAWSSDTDQARPALHPA